MGRVKKSHPMHQWGEGEGGGAWTADTVGSGQNALKLKRTIFGKHFRKPFGFGALDPALTQTLSPDLLLYPSPPLLRGLAFRIHLQVLRCRRRRGIRGRGREGATTRMGWAIVGNVEILHVSRNVRASVAVRGRFSSGQQTEMIRPTLP